MRRLTLAVAVVASTLLLACGDPSAQPKTMTARQALTSNSEVLEFETPAARQELFRDIARSSQVEAGRETNDPVLFPVISDGRLVAAAPGLDTKADLLDAGHGGRPLQLAFNGREQWPEDRRDSLQGLSEREAAELVARSLLSRWGVTTGGEIVVERAAGAPYAAAYVDGMIRINPSFLYLAASVGPSVPSTLQ